jgi:hypothetical protein
MEDAIKKRKGVQFVPEQVVRAESQELPYLKND